VIFDVRVFLENERKKIMTKLMWAIVMALVVANVAFLTAFSGIRDVKGAGCQADGCADSVIEYNECAHLEDYDPCASNVCVKNLEYYPGCPSNTESDESCPVTFDNNAIRNRTYLRFTNNCTTGNQSTWNRHEFTNPCWVGLAYETRCETGGCSGTEVPGYTTTPVCGRYVCQ
jgi:hypothetical protein